MKKLILSSVVLLFSAQKVNSQNINDVSASDKAVTSPAKELSPELTAQRQSTRAGAEYGLSEDQKQKYSEYALTRINANRPLKKQMETASDKDKKKLNQQIKSNRDAFDKKVKALLNPEQLTKWEAEKIKNKEIKGSPEQD